MQPRYQYAIFFAITGMNGTSFGEKVLDLAFEVTTEEHLQMVRQSIQEVTPKGFRINLTGVSLLKKIVPKTKKVAVYQRPTNLLHS